MSAEVMLAAGHVAYIIQAIFDPSASASVRGAERDLPVRARRRSMPLKTTPHRHTVNRVDGRIPGGEVSGHASETPPDGFSLAASGVGMHQKCYVFLILSQNGRSGACDTFRGKESGS